MGIMTICALVVCQTKKITLAIEGGMQHAHGGPRFILFV